jgi:invasion protein IalB
MARFRFAFLGAAALLFGLPAAAQENPDKPAQPPAVNSWTINCGSTTDVNKLECQMSQVLTESKTGQRVLTVTIRKAGADGVLGMILMLPHGIYLPSGATYQVDAGEKAPAAIQTADQNGSYASVPLNDTLVQALKRGTTLNVGMETANRQPITLPVSLTGFAVTYDKLVAMN